MPRIIKGLIPPTGWYYMQRIGPHLVRVDGPNHDGLLEAVTHTRTANGLEIGNVAEDVALFICSISPIHCKSDAPGVAHASPGRDVQKRARLLDRVYWWTSRLVNERLEYVEPKEVHRREDICRACIKNRVYDTCAACRDTIIAPIKFNMGKILEGRKKADLKGCDHFGHTNEIAVHLDKKHLNLELLNGNTPQACWVR